MLRLLHASAVCGFFGLSNAIRTDFQSSEDTVLGVGMVLNKIRVLLPEDLQKSSVFMQVMGGLQSKSDATPNVTENLQTMLQSTIDDIENVVETQIRDTHSGTQTEVNSKFEGLEFLVASTIASKTSAVEPCTKASSASHFEWEATNPVNFACSIGASGSCDSQLKIFKDRLDKVRTSLKDKFDKAAREFKSYTDSCVAAKCEFGEALQTQCGQASEFNSFVNGLGNERHDRQDEWKSASVIKCLLNGVVQGKGELTEEGLQLCDSKVDYALQVGTLDFRNKALKDLLATTDACDATSVTFNGFSEQFTSEDGQPPFTQCAGDPTTI